jgi:hypothetical protein
MCSVSTFVALERGNSQTDMWSDSHKRLFTVMFGSEIVPFQGKGMGKVCRYISSCNETSNSSGTRSLGLWGRKEWAIWSWSISVQEKGEKRSKNHAWPLGTEVTGDSRMRYICVCVWGWVICTYINTQMHIHMYMWIANLARVQRRGKSK